VPYLHPTRAKQDCHGDHDAERPCGEFSPGRSALRSICRSERSNPWQHAPGWDESQHPVRTASYLAPRAVRQYAVLDPGQAAEQSSQNKARRETRATAGGRTMKTGHGTTPGKQTFEGSNDLAMKMPWG
jgi:hypothetical protein